MSFKVKETQVKFRRFHPRTLLWQRVLLLAYLPELWPRPGFQRNPREALSFNEHNTNKPPQNISRKVVEQLPGPPGCLPTRAHPTTHPSQVQAAGAGPRLGQVVGLRLGRAVGSWRWPCCGCSITGAGTDGSGRLGRSSQAWWCPPTINTPHPIFRSPQSFAHMPCTQTIISLSHFQSIPIQTKKITLEQEAGYINMLHTCIFCIPFLPNSWSSLSCGSKGDLWVLLY